MIPGDHPRSADLHDCQGSARPRYRKSGVQRDRPENGPCYNKLAVGQRRLFNPYMNKECLGTSTSECRIRSLDLL